MKDPFDDWIIEPRAYALAVMHEYLIFFFKNKYVNSSEEEKYQFERMQKAIYVLDDIYLTEKHFKFLLADMKRNQINGLAIIERQKREINILKKEIENLKQNIK